MFPHDAIPDDDEPYVKPDLILTPEADSSLFSACARYSELIDRKRELQAQLKIVEVEAARLEPRLLQAFQQRSMTSMAVNDMTISLRPEIWARPKAHSSRRRVCQALIAAGKADLVESNFNTLTVSSWVRELARDHADDLKSGRIASVAQLLPPEVALELNVEPSYKIRTRRH